VIRFPRQAEWFTGPGQAAPFACLFFLLLIFLVLLTHLAPVPGVRIELPEVSHPDGSAAADWVVVVVDRSGRLYLNQQLVTEGQLDVELSRRVSRSVSPLEVVLQADLELQLGDLTRLHDVCLKAGVRSIRYQTRTKPRLGERLGDADREAR
jgi:biopolymer transport protein ExbD